MVAVHDLTGYTKADLRILLAGLASLEREGKPVSKTAAFRELRDDITFTLKGPQ